MAVDVRVFEQLRRLVCGEALLPLGPTQMYMGSEVVPAVIWFDVVAREQLRMARAAGPDMPLHALLPLLFPPAPEDRP